jgi:hypothetical protein
MNFEAMTTMSEGVRYIRQLYHFHAGNKWLIQSVVHLSLLLIKWAILVDSMVDSQNYLCCKLLDASERARVVSSDYVFLFCLKLSCSLIFSLFSYLAWWLSFLSSADEDLKEILVDGCIVLKFKHAWTTLVCITALLSPNDLLADAHCN